MKNGSPPNGLNSTNQELPLIWNTPTDFGEVLQETNRKFLTTPPLSS